MAEFPYLEKRMVKATALAIGDTNPELALVLEDLLGKDEHEKRYYKSHAANCRLELPTCIAAAILASLQTFATTFDDPRMALLNDVSLTHLIHEWTMIVAGLTEIRAPSGQD